MVIGAGTATQRNTSVALGRTTSATIPGSTPSDHPWILAMPPDNVHGYTDRSFCPCWFCHGTGDVAFSCEFDCYVHMACLKAAAADPDNREAQIMLTELT